MKELWTWKNEGEAFRIVPGRGVARVFKNGDRWGTLWNWHRIRGRAAPLKWHLSSDLAIADLNSMISDFDELVD